MRERLQITALLALLVAAPGTSAADETLRDPTRPYKPHAHGIAGSPRYTVNTIIVSSERKVAIVNGQRVGVGGTVDGATVIAIEEKALVLERNGKRITVKLN